MSTSYEGASADAPITSELLDCAQAIEHLPLSTAFEHAMYEQSFLRKATHVARSPITLTTTIINGKFPDTFSAMFPREEYSIENLTITQTELNENETKPTTLLIMAFTSSGTPHYLTVEDSQGTYSTQNTYGDEVTYDISSSDATALIASFAYARQFSATTRPSTFTLAEQSLQVARKDSEAALREQLITTLGNFDGESRIETVASFPLGSETMIATLIEEEHPDASNVSNSIELSKLRSSDMLDEYVTAIHQHHIDLEKLSETFDQQYAIQTSRDNEHLIEPEKDYTEWATLCSEFLPAISPYLEKYALLEEY